MLQETFRFVEGSGGGIELKVRMMTIVFAICSISFSLQFSYGKDYVIDTDIKWKDQSDVPSDIDSLLVKSKATLTIGGGNYEKEAIVVETKNNISVHGTIVMVGEYTIADPTNPKCGYPDGHGHTLKAENILIPVGGKISANKEGFSCISGPGGGTYYGGAYGGRGSWRKNDTYGSTNCPLDLGSGGGAAPGGGAIHLVVSDTLDIKGKISSNGGNLYDCLGAGSGGSIFIVTKKLVGTGIISANGGDGDEIGGGGGRIAIYSRYTAFSGQVTVDGGADKMHRDLGEQGTIYRNTLAEATLVSPKDGAQLSSLPTLDIQLIDKDNEHVYLKIELAKDSQFASNLKVYDQIFSQEGFVGQNSLQGTAYTSGSIATFKLKAPLPSGKWHWRAYAIDAKHTTICGFPSKTWSFFVK